MKNDFKAVEFMRAVRERNSEKHAESPELLENELADIREKFKHLRRYEKVKKLEQEDEKR